MKTRQRKGFYFSFDAIIALMIISATMVFATQSSSIAASEFDSTRAQFQASNTVGRDVIRQASVQTFQTFNASFKQSLVDNTVMTSSDLDRPILEGITYLWASGDQDYARKAIKTYFGPKIEKNYALRIIEKGNSYVVYREENRSSTVESVSTAKSLVSGFSLNRTSIGYRSRATVLGAIANKTSVFPISPVGTLESSGGGGFTGNTLETTKQFHIDASSVAQATIDIAIEEGPSHQFRTLEVNGQEVDWPDSAELYSKNNVAYYRMNITEEIQPGLNTVWIELANPRGGSTTRLYPGTRVKAVYQEEPATVASELVMKKMPVKEVVSSVRQNSDSGVFDVEEFVLDPGSRVVNATLELHAQQLEPGCGPNGWDVQVFVNEQNVLEDCGQNDYVQEINITPQVENGSNLVTIYVNHNGSQFWGGQETRLVGNSTSNPSMITVWYRRDTSTEYGIFQARTAEEVGGANENPKTYSTTFNYSRLSSSNLYLSQVYSEQPAIEVRPGSGNYTTVFNASVAARTPTKIAIDPGNFNLSETNYIRMTDPGSDAEFLKYSLFEYTVAVPTRVGYGNVFPTAEAAREDAVQRLENKLGEFIDATEISADTVSIGGQEKLFGPSIVKLVVWESG